MFESRRKAPTEQPVPGPEPRVDDWLLRNETDPDPLIEEMVQRLREGVGSLTAFDEWGRPLSWRNLVRLAVGPLSGRLRDAETAAGLAVTLMRSDEEPRESQSALGWPDADGALVVPSQSPLGAPDLVQEPPPEVVASSALLPGPAAEGHPMVVDPLNASFFARPLDPVDPVVAAYDRYLKSLEAGGRQSPRGQDGGSGQQL